MPLSFAYAVVKHKVLEIPVLVETQRSLRPGTAWILISPVRGRGYDDRTLHAPIFTILPGRNQYLVWP